MAQERRTFCIGIPIYEGVDLLDVAAPYEIFNWMKERVDAKMRVEVYLIAEKKKKAVRTRDRLEFFARTSFRKAPRLDLLWVPGGDPAELKRMMNHPPYIKFLKDQSKHATYVTSVCEGALLLASAGLLDGREATTHWAFIPCLKQYPEIKIAEGYPRFVVNEYEDKNKKKRYVITGGGISSGLDEALELVRLIAGEKVAESVQLTTQYFPRPPVQGTIKGTDTCPMP